MRAAIICEFNPFHNGHKFLLEKIKTEYTEDIVAIMSGNFVQRGDISIIDKYQKTEIALKNNVSLVVELPTIYALSNAESFADCGVKIAKSLNCDTLFFGIESDFSKIHKIANTLDDNDVKKEIKKKMDDGENYPKSISIVIENILGVEYKEIINKPNNILAFEYIKACKKYSLSPIGIKRINVEHDSNNPVENIASASYIRECVLNNKDYEKYTEIKIENEATLKNIENILIYKLRSLNAEDYKNIKDVSEGLENRIIDSINKFNTLDEIISDIKTKRYTEARIRRILLSALLNITKDLYSDKIYARILGMNKIGETYLKECKIPLITKVSKGYQNLDKEIKKIFDIDVNASNIYSLAKAKKEKPTNEFMQKIIKNA